VFDCETGGAGEAPADAAAGRRRWKPPWTRQPSANLVAALAFQQHCFRNFDLRKHTYDQIKAESGWPPRPPSM